MVISKWAKKNTGKNSEAQFQERLQTGYGKKVMIYRVVDSAEIAGRTQGRGWAPATPSDFIITADGRMMFAEVKSSQAKTSFSFSNITPEQRGYARKQSIAGGEYVFFIHNLNTNEWYQVPALVILDHERGSIKWSELENYKWQQNTLM